MKNWIARTLRKKQRPETAMDREAAAEVHQLVELLRTVQGGGVAEALAAVLRRLAADGPRIERGIVAWVLLTEALIQSAEQRYPSGKGRRKKAQVRAALYHIFQSPDIAIPAIPAPLVPLVMDGLIDWSIDAIAASVDDYALWDESEPLGWSLAGACRAGLSALLLLLTPFFSALNWLYVGLRYRQPLTPEVAAAVARVQAEGTIADKSVLFASVYAVGVFVGGHRVQMIAAVKAFFEVVSMAERLVSARGPEKKAYACAVVKAALAELGFPVRGVLTGAIADAVISAGIESALALFRKRAPESFSSRGDIVQRQPEIAVRGRYEFDR
ncbi:hypothetical protein [Sphingomonas sp. TDK1]|uniref:hypothetical protein n=1 Tax=Sphingomonas sp. TDK1 TaxID=453247 RepID=UPI0007DA1BFF|nr:hypothetical protein [Sphingomonas sp. TDK1]OAN67119.1 hypothetical protein A7X12_00355 [Sphingomonas sp. TDK1]